MARPLAGKIAVVAGATRGAGRGIATALGEAGATVYCTGRSVPGSPGMKNRPETINETAELVTARLVVEITDGDAYFYRGHFFYDLVKTSVIRMAFGLSQELKGRGITSVAVTPGFLRSEWMLDNFGVTEANWRDAATKMKSFIASETPLFVGRGIAALAADPNVATKNGRVIASWDLGDEYGVTDADGSRPHFVRWLRENEPTVAEAWKKLDDTFYSYWGSMPYETPGS
jgi:NAD(P)-dependent dehydrogenase (short-subunit alcohol dehydrogenase family)